MDLGCDFVYLRPDDDDLRCPAGIEEEEEVKLREEDNAVVSEDSDSDDGETCLLNILDTAGQEEYSSLREQSTRTGDGFVIVYSVTDVTSFQEAQAIHRWLKRFRDESSLHVVLCGNKADLEEDRKVASKEGQKLAKDLGVPFFETSAKTGDNVAAVYHGLLRTIPRVGTDYKIVMLGSGAVGKSSVTLRFTQDLFMKDYDPTIEDVYRKMIRVSGQPKGEKRSKKQTKKASSSSASRSAAKFGSRERPRSSSMVAQSSSAPTKLKGLLSTFQRVFRVRRKSTPNPVTSNLPDNVCHSSYDQDDDEDSSEGGEGEGEDLKGRAASSSSSGGKTRVIRQRKTDGNVVLVPLGKLEEEPNLLTGDPVQCGSCQAVLSSTSVLTPHPKKKAPLKNWSCEFCGFLNAALDISEEEVPKGDSFDFLLVAAPESEACGVTKEDEDVPKTSGYTVYCIDVSGSMSSCCQMPDFQTAWRVERTGGQSAVGSVSRLSCIKEAVQRQLAQLHVDRPDKRTMVMQFGSDVAIVGGGEMTSGGTSTFTGVGIKSFAELVHYGADLASRYQLKPLGDSFEQLKGAVEGMISTGGTALGPALSICMGFLGSIPNSEIILCTDGMPNEGVGSMPQRTSSNFYKQVGDYAKRQKTVINILAVEGERVGLPVVQVAAEKSGGRVNILKPLEMVRQLRQIMQNPVVAMSVTLTCFLHPSFVFDEPGYPDNQNRLCKEVGIVLKEDDLTFRFKLKAGIRPPALDHVPFQIQLRYTRLDGTQCLRVLSKSSQTTSSRKTMEAAINVSVLGTAAVKKTAILAREGKVQEANFHLNSVKRLAKRGSVTTAQKEDLCAFRAECRGLDEEISSNIKSWSTGSDDVLENRFNLVVNNARVGHYRFMNATKKAFLSKSRTASEEACELYDAFKF